MACSVLEKYPLLFEGKESDFDAICNTAQVLAKSAQKRTMGVHSANAQ